MKQSPAVSRGALFVSAKMLSEHIALGQKRTRPRSRAMGRGRVVVCVAPGSRDRRDEPATQGSKCSPPGGRCFARFVRGPFIARASPSPTGMCTPAGLFPLARPGCLVGEPPLRAQLGRSRTSEPVRHTPRGFARQSADPPSGLPGPCRGFDASTVNCRPVGGPRHAVQRRDCLTRAAFLPAAEPGTPGSPRGPFGPTGERLAGSDHAARGSNVAHWLSTGAPPSCPPKGVRGVRNAVKRAPRLRAHDRPQSPPR